MCQLITYQRRAEFWSKNKVPQRRHCMLMSRCDLRNSMQGMLLELTRRVMKLLNLFWYTLERRGSYIRGITHLCLGMGSFPDYGEEEKQWLQVEAFGWLWCSCYFNVGDLSPFYEDEINGDGSKLRTISFKIGGDCFRSLFFFLKIIAVRTL